jgi:hypothetical protein
MINARIFKLMVCCLGILFLVDGCRLKQTPDNVLTRAEMAKALTELYIQEARANRQGISPDSVRSVLEYFQARYAEKNNFPDSAIAVSYQYYLARPKDLSDIYDVVIDSLALREQRAHTSRYNNGAPQ